MSVLNLFIVFILLSFSSLAASTEAKKTFYWADDQDSPPLIYRDSNGQPAGIFYEIMTEAFRRMEIPLKAEVFPWARAQKLVKEGVADGMVTILTEERKAFVRASDPILLVTEHIFTNKNNPRVDQIMAIRSLKELKPFKVVEVLGSGWTEETLKGVDITWVPKMDNAFKMLIKGRVDIYIANGYTGADFIKKKIRHNGLYVEGYKSIITNPYPLKIIAFRLLIRKDSPFVNILDRFNRTIHQMKTDGTIGRIIEGRKLIDITDKHDRK
jgi:polar amino acid transport system substrate-binding protein